jgi:hypothetical protein
VTLTSPQKCHATRHVTLTNHKRSCHPSSDTHNTTNNLAIRHVTLTKPHKKSCHPSCDAHKTKQKNLVIRHVTLTTPHKNLAVRHVTLTTPEKILPSIM